MSTKKHLIEVRSNTNFGVNYETMELVPQVELILLLQEPKYQVVKKKGEAYINKDFELAEFRCKLSLNALNHLIGKLQETAAGLQHFEQMSVAMNGVLAQARVVPKEEGK